MFAAGLRAAPTDRNHQAENEIHGEIVRALVTTLTPLVAEITKLIARLVYEVAALADGQIVASSRRAGRINAAQILAEIGDVRKRFQTENQLVAEAGVRPVTHASGESRGVVLRWACDHYLRAAITGFADMSRHSSTSAADIYRRARQRGCNHPHAT